MSNNLLSLLDCQTDSGTGGGGGGGSGTVTSVGLTSSDSSLQIGGTNPVTSSGNIDVKVLDVKLSKIDKTGAATNDVIKYDGTNVVWGPEPGGGSVTSVGLDSPDESISITNSPITSSGIIHIEVEAVDLSKIKQDGATEGQVVTWDQATTQWKAKDPQGGGGVGISIFDGYLDGLGTAINAFVTLQDAYTESRKSVLTTANITESAITVMTATDQINLYIGQNTAWDLSTFYINGSNLGETFNLNMVDSSCMFKFSVTPFQGFDITSGLVINANGGTIQSQSVTDGSFITGLGTFIVKDAYFLLPNAADGGIHTAAESAIYNVEFVGGGSASEVAFDANGGRLTGLIFSGSYKSNANLNYASGPFNLDGATVNLGDASTLIILGTASSIRNVGAGALTLNIGSNSTVENSEIDSVVFDYDVTNCKTFGLIYTGAPYFANDNSNDSLTHVNETYEEFVDIYGTNHTFIGCTFNGGGRTNAGSTGRLIGCTAATTFTNSGAFAREGNDSNIGNDSSGGGTSITYFDCEVDGSGSLPNTYATVGAAVSAGKKAILVTANTTETAGISLSSSVEVWLTEANMMAFSTNSVNLNSFSIIIQRHGASNNLPGIQYTTSTSTSPLFTGGGTFSSVILKGIGIDFTNVTGSGSSLCESAQIYMDYCYFIVGSADSSGLTISDISFISNSTIQLPSTASLNAVKSSEYFFMKSCLIDCQNNALSGYCLSVDTASALISDLVIQSGQPNSIKLSGNVKGLSNKWVNYSTGFDLDIDSSSTHPLYLSDVEAGNGIVSLNSTGSSIDNFRCENLILNGSLCNSSNGVMTGSVNITGVSCSALNLRGITDFVVGAFANIKIIGCDASGTFTDNSTTGLIRVGNNAVIGNDYSSIPYFDAIVDGVGGEPNTYQTLKAAIDAGCSSIVVVDNTSEPGTITLSRRVYVELRNGVINLNTHSIILNHFDFTLYQPVRSTLVYLRYAGNASSPFSGNDTETLSIKNAIIDLSATTGDNCKLGGSFILQIEESTVLAGNGENCGVYINSIPSYIANSTIIVGGVNSQVVLANYGGLVDNVLIRVTATGPLSNYIAFLNQSESITKSLFIESQEDVSILASGFVNLIAPQYQSPGKIKVVVDPQTIVSTPDYAFVSNLNLNGADLEINIGGAIVSNFSNVGNVVIDASNVSLSNGFCTGINVEAASSSAKIVSLAGMTSFTVAGASCSIAASRMGSGGTFSYTGSGIQKCGNDTVIGNSYTTTEEKGQPNGIATLNSDGYLHEDQIQPPVFVSADIVMQPFRYYIIEGSSLVTLSLPTSFERGDVFTVLGDGTGGWKIEQNAGQYIKAFNIQSTTGTGGYISSTEVGDKVVLIGVSDDVSLRLSDIVGNPLIN